MDGLHFCIIMEIILFYMLKVEIIDLKFNINIAFSILALYVKVHVNFYEK